MQDEGFPSPLQVKLLGLHNASCISSQARCFKLGYLQRLRVHAIAVHAFIGQCRFFMHGASATTLSPQLPMQVPLYQKYAAREELGRWNRIYEYLLSRPSK